MANPTIKISQLNSFPSNLLGEDFFPIDKSSSLLTYKATLSQLASYVSTGSFSGSFRGTLTGTASYATTASYVLGASISGSVISASYALTASYISSSGNSLSGSGTIGYLPIWASNNGLGNSPLYYNSLNDIYTASNAGFLLSKPSGQSYFIVEGGYNGNVVIRSQFSSSDSWTLLTYGDSAGDPSRGSFELNSFTASNQFSGKQPSGSTPVVKAVQIVSNGIYLWPNSQIQSVSSDATVTIGAGYVNLISASTLNTSSRLRIFVYSGSNASNPQINHLSRAIEVLYGSGSDTTGYNVTFGVSSSGQVVGSGFSGSNFNNVAFYGSASYALTSSFGSATSAQTASYLTITNNYQVNRITGSIFSGSQFSGSFSGSFLGSITSASFAATASLSTTSSFALTASYVSGSSGTSISASYAATASLATTSSYAITASYVLSGSSISSSYAVTSSFSSNSALFNLTSSTVFAVTGSNTFSGSQTLVGGNVILTQVSRSLNFVDDTAAAAGGVPLGGLYRSGNFILIRLG